MFAIVPCIGAMSPESALCARRGRVLVGLSVLVTALIGRSGDEITAGITTTVVTVVAESEPAGAWRRPILRLADTVIGNVRRLSCWPRGPRSRRGSIPWHITLASR